MKTTINLHDFREAFRRYGRATQFSYDGFEILFNYFEEVEQDMGEEIELDVIAICCEYYEADPKEIAENYGIDIKEMDDDAIAEAVRDYLEDAGVYIGATDLGMIVYRPF